MTLKHLSYRTESLLNIIINKIIKEGRWIEGKPWVSMTQVHLSKILKCTPNCVSHHICKLVEEGVLLREQHNIKSLDRTNYYSINPLVCENSNFKRFFSRSITKKINDIYSINNKSFTKSINQSEGKFGLIGLASANGDSDLGRSPALPPILEQQAKEECHVDTSLANQPKTTIVQDMLRIWRREINAQEFIDFKKVSPRLVQAFRVNFEGSLEKWKSYVAGLKNSKYISGMQKKFKSILSWALSFKVINRIFAGGFGVTLGEVLGVKPEQPSTTDDDATSPAEEHIESVTETEACKEIRREVLTTYGETEYLSWFRRVTLEESGSDILIKGLSFVTDMVKRRYFMSNDRIIDAGEEYVSEEVVNKAEEERTQSELISEGYIGASRIRAALFHCRDLRLGR